MVLHKVLKKKGRCGFGRVVFSDRVVLVLVWKEAWSQVTEVTRARVGCGSELRGTAPCHVPEGRLWISCDDGSDPVSRAQLWG